MWSGIGISILSYDGRVYFGLIADRKLISDPNTVIARFHPEFEKLMYLGMMLPLKGRPSGRLAQILLDEGLKQL